MGGSFVHTNLIPKETNNNIAVTIIIIIIIIMKSQHSEGMVYIPLKLPHNTPIAISRLLFVLTVEPLVKQVLLLGLITPAGTSYNWVFRHSFLCGLERFPKYTKMHFLLLPSSFFNEIWTYTVLVFLHSKARVGSCLRYSYLHAWSFLKHVSST